jgi:hypothetical protein
MASKQTVSICIDKLLDAMNQNHPSFKKGSDGRTYVNLQIWTNDEADKFGNHISVQLYDKDGNPKSTYIGNGKIYNDKQS